MSRRNRVEAGAHPITGTCRSIDARHTPRYLAAYECRYNRRFELPKNLERLTRVAVTIAPKPYREITAVRSKKTAGTSGGSGKLKEFRTV